MAISGKKWPKYFAILVALVIVVESIAFTMTGYAKNDTKTVSELTSEDKTTVSEISNMTGVKADEIIKLRKEGKTWNEILEIIKNNPGYKVEGDSTKRSDTLAKTGLDEDALKKLKEEGFTEEEILEAKSLAERVVFQLEEIANMGVMTPQLPEPGPNIDGKKAEDLTAYTALTGKIDLNEAVYLILKLRDEFGSMQAVLDEYLYSLQLGIELDQYLTDKEGYRKLKQQKAVELAAQEIVTAAKIEEKMLGMLQKNNKDEEALPQIQINADAPSLPDAAKESPLPDVQAPSAQDVKPQNPAEAVMQEIEDIKGNNAEQVGR